MTEEELLGGYEILKDWAERYNLLKDFPGDMAAYELILSKNARIQELESALDGVMKWANELPVEYGSAMIVGAAKALLDKTEDKE